MPDHTAPGFTPESLAMSAALFTSAIDAWVPASFGPPKTDAERAKELNDALVSASVDAKSDRMGLGHPDRLKSKQAGANGTSLSTLEQKLKGKSKGRRPAEEAHSTSTREVDHSEEDEAESRVKAVGKNKRKADPFDLSQKKKAKKSTAGQPSIRPQVNLISAQPVLLEDTGGQSDHDGEMDSPAAESMQATRFSPNSPISSSASSRVPEALLNANRSTASKNQKTKARKKRAKLAKLSTSV